MRSLNFLLLSAVFVLGGCGSPGKPAVSLSPENIAGRRLYLARCAKCHKLYDPTHYSDEEWNHWLDKMTRKAKLQPPQRESIAHYVEEAIRHPEKFNPTGER